MFMYRKGDDMGSRENRKYSEWLQNPYQPSFQPSPAILTLPRAQECHLHGNKGAFQFIPVFVSFLHLMGRRRCALSHFENNPIENINELIMHTIKKNICVGNSVTKNVKNFLKSTLLLA